MTNLAISRRSDVVSRVEGDETLVLDLQTKTAHCLSGDVAAVWNADESSVAAIAAGAGLSESAVEAAVASLVELGLVSPSAGMSRRTLVMRGAVVGGAVVTTIALPTAAMASSNVGTPTITSVSPASGPMGTVVTVTGTGFKTTGGQIASVKIGADTVTPSNTTITAGAFSFTFTVPNAADLTPSGATLATLITVKDNAGVPNSATHAWTVNKPAVTLSSSTFAKNGSPKTFTVTTTVPFANSSVTTVTGSAGFTISPSSVTTTASGAIPAGSFTVTYANGFTGSGTVTFTDSFGNTVAAPVSVV